MTCRLSLRRFASLLLSACAFLAADASAQAPPQPDTPSIAEMEAALEKTWATALAMDDSVEPMWRMQAFEMIAMQELMLDRVRASARGVPDEQLPNADASRDRMIARWRRERPGDVGPDLFLIFFIDDMQERLAPALALLARHPDSVLVMALANMVLRNLDQTAHAGELLEGFLQRNPASSQAYRMLLSHYASLQDETRQTELIARWAQREPVDPAAVAAWLGSSLAEQEPAATAALLDRFFAGQPQGSAALPVCSEVAQQRADYRAAARACLARIAGGGDGTPAATQAAERATAELAGLAGREGDWAGLLASLERLPLAQRRQALLAAAQQVPAPARCDTRVELLRVAAEGARADEKEARSVANSIAAALRPCAAHRAARAMYLDLLRTAPNPGDLVVGWTAKHGGRVLGDVPAAEAAPILERRLAENPGAELQSSLFRALDVAYQMVEDHVAHRALLASWQRQQPEEMRSDQAVALARYLLGEEKPGEAIAVLAGFSKLSTELPALEMLWELHHATGQPQQAEQLVADLLAGDDWRVAIGHLLAGRGVLMKGDLAGAERGYTAYLQRFASTKVAGELVAAAAHLQGPPAGAALAARLCAAASFPEGRSGPAACAAALLAAGGDTAAAAKLLAQQAVQSPDDLPTLRELAWRAHSVQQWEIAELTWRRIVALDPKARHEWVHLGVVLEKRGKTGELDRLLSEARAAFQSPPVDLLRAAGRAWSGAGDGRRATSLLEEARAAMPEGAELAWINAELRQAYAAAGRWENPYATPADEARLAALQRAAAAGDLAATYDYGVESLRAERSREQCERGIQALERAAGAGHKKSAAYLGRALYYGSAPCRAAAPAAALAWLRRAVDATTRRPEGIFDLGLALLLGDAGESAPAEGVALIERAAAFPHLLAVEVAGLAHLSGLGVPRDVARARTYFAQADRLGSDSLQRLADNAAEWPQIAAVARRAVERLQALADQGDAAASGLLARLHQVERLVPDEPKRMLALAQAAAARGDALAMRVLYYAHRTGEGVARDDDEALRWLRRGAEAGDSYCMMFLSQRLMKGETVPRDVALGLTWLERAANAGNQWALRDVAHLHAEGWHGLPRDPGKAAPWMKRLAEQGDFEARGWLALHGHPVKELKEIDE